LALQRASGYCGQLDFTAADGTCPWLSSMRVALAVAVDLHPANDTCPWLSSL